MATNVPKKGTTVPNMGMAELLPDDHIKCVAHDCPSKAYCYHYTRPLQDGLTWIMPINVGVDCPDFEPVEDE